MTEKLRSSAIRIGPHEESTEVPTHNEREVFYQERIRRFVTSAEALEAKSHLVSNLRGLSFGAIVIFGSWATFGQPQAWVAWVAAAAGIGFLFLVNLHSRVLAAEEIALRWVHVNRAAKARAGVAWKKFSEDGSSFANPIHPYSGDLDIFGPGSLFQKMSVARTQFGKYRLASFLMNRAQSAVVKHRQQAAIELTPLLEWRQEFEALALPMVEPLKPNGVVPTRPEKSPDSAEQLLGWAESKPAFSTNAPLVFIAYAGPILTIGVLLSAMVLGWHPITWIGALIAQAIILLTAKNHSARVFAAVSSSQGVFLRFGPMLRLLEGLDPESVRLKELKAMAESQQRRPPSSVMRDFERIVGWFELRHNGMIYPFINGLLMWDIHCVLRLEAWQKESGTRLRGWFKALGELEALSSLAAFSADNPEFIWPEVGGDAPHFEAEALGHPMISRDLRVPNDVSLPGAGRGLLVTGSNMSGKSTLLRSMGINTALALAGAPVCARALRLSPLALRTSMRISDSLDAGVSHFYAEVRKLKAVLDATPGEVPVFFLLDEILHGTNSRERQIGARWVLGELLRRGALGAVSTHDGGLCELPEPVMSQVEQVHLRETVTDGEMTFDFKLRPGPVKSGNALLLMRASGIEVPLE